MKRKDFLMQIGAVALTGGALFTSCKKDDDSDNAIANAGGCSITGSDELGPFFVAGTSEVVNINTQNVAGTKMMVTGKVYSGTGTSTPIEGAKIEIWHADGGGVYHPEGSGDVSNYGTSAINLRGFVITYADGSYAFESIRPGLYGNRARHIHYKITVAEHTTLVTQSYFKGDPRISEDSLSSVAGDCRIVSFTDDGNGGIQGEMNFNLEKNT